MQLSSFVLSKCPLPKNKRPPTRRSSPTTLQRLKKWITNLIVNSGDVAIAPRTPGPVSTLKVVTIAVSYISPIQKIVPICHRLFITKLGRLDLERHPIGSTVVWGR
jgi:hypothetical protein